MQERITAFLEAASTGDVQAVLQVLHNGLSPAAATAGGWTALDAAAMSGQHEVVQALLTHGSASPAHSFHSFHFHKALLSAAAAGHAAALKVLHAAGASAGWLTPADLLLALNIAAQQGNEEVVEYVAQVIDIRQLGGLALFAAATKGYERIVALLLNAGADFHATAGPDNWMVLHFAALRGHSKVVEQLIQAGADVHAATARGSTALTLAAEEGHCSTVETLLHSGSDITTATHICCTALYYACISAHRKVVQQLLQAAAKLGQLWVVNVPNHLNLTLLICAAYSGCMDIVQQLVQAGADVNAADYNGFTALIVAATRGYNRFVTWLLGNGADVTTATSEHMTPLHIACVAGHSDVAQQLVAHVVQHEGGRHSWLINAPGKSGNTPLHYAASRGNSPLVQQLLENGADPNAVTDLGSTALTIVAEAGHGEVVMQLLQMC